MKPVNLLPKGSGTTAVATEPQKLNLGVIGGIAGAAVVLFGVGVYLALARVDTVKSETAQVAAAQTSAASEEQQVRATIASVGTPITDSDKLLADGQEQLLVSAFSDRYNYVELTRELTGIMQGTGGWYSGVKVSTAGGDTGGGTAATPATITIEAVMPTMELAAGFYKRVEGTTSMSAAEATKFESKQLLSIFTKKMGTYIHFTVTATFDDTIAPSAAGAIAVGSTTGTPVANSDGGTLELSLDSEPTPTKTAAQIAAAKQVKAHKAAAAAEAAKPKNPFDEVAADVAGGAS